MFYRLSAQQEQKQKQRFRYQNIVVPADYVANKIYWLICFHLYTIENIEFYYTKTIIIKK